MSIKFCLDVKGDDYIILCNFGGRMMRRRKRKKPVLMGLILILEPSSIRLLLLGRDIITVYRENQQYRGRYYELQR